MAQYCEICGTENQSRKDRFCPRHQRAVLRQLERSGYLEPLTVTTVDGVQRLSNRRFLTLPDDQTPNPQR